MASEWRATTWGHEISLEYGKALRGYSDKEGLYRVFGSNGPIGWHNEAISKGPGVILGRKGAYRGVQYSRDPFFVIDTAYYVVPKTEIDLRWLYYAIIHYRLGEIDDGSPIPSTTRAAVYIRDLNVPPIHEQHAIADVLGTLDDKIELNRQMNETLESMARAFFKSWFVDFDPVRAKAEGRDAGLPTPVADLFPDSFEDSELGELPRGWGVKTAGDVAERIAMGPFGASIKVETFVADGVPIISGQHLRGPMLEDLSFNFITEEHAQRLANANVARGDVVFTHAGNIGQVAFIPIGSRYERYVISQRQFFMRCDLSHVTPIYVVLFFSSEVGRHRLLANTSSSGVPSIARPVTYLRSLPLVIPPRSVLDAFDRIVQPLFTRLRHGKGNIEASAALRDALIPKLISGELRIKDVKRIIGKQV
jgi:type I restriction enzyme S subunit